MKRWIFILIFLPIFAFAQDQVVNIYNWSGYMPDKVISLFEKETGIKVNYSVFEDNQGLYAKLKADPGAHYDVIVPSSYMVQQMWQEGMLHRLNKKELPNFKYLNPHLLNHHFDPENQYSVPYLWGTTGILVNTTYYQLKDFRSWKDLWAKNLYNKISMLNDMRDTFSIALKRLGYSINDLNPKHIFEAYQSLVALLPNVESFSANGSQQMYVNEDANIGIMESGDAEMVLREKPEFRYVYPKEGTIIWIDNLAIPKNAPHLKNAYRFINFIFQPKIAKMISVGLGYSSANEEAVKLMSKKMKKNRIINPTKVDLKHAEVEGYLPPKIHALMLEYWELLKLRG